MMKFVYIALIPILAVLIAIYTIMLLSYHPYVIDKKLTEQTNSLIKNSPTLGIKELAAHEAPMHHAVPSDIWENNLFDPNRGGAATVSGPEGLKNIELVGIFNNGNVKGAVILMKTAESGGAGGYGSYGGGYGGGYAYGDYGQAQPSYSQKQQQVRVPPKTVFKVGDRLPNGLILESVGNDFVTLRGGKDSLDLKMTFADENSFKRMAEASKIAVKPPVTIISGTQPHSGQSGIAAGSPTTIIPTGSGSGGTQSQGIFQGY